MSEGAHEALWDLMVVVAGVYFRNFKAIFLIRALFTAYVARPSANFLFMYAGTPPHDIIEAIVETIVTTIPRQKFEVQPTKKDSPSTATPAEPKASSTKSNITYIKFVLTQKGLDTFCRKFHIPESGHPQLPSRNQMMHERPVGKIGVYTRFFKYANFWLPLSTFLVDVLSIEPMVGLFWCFYVNSKNKGWMSFSKRSDSSAVCYTKPIDSLKHWNDHFFWVDAFACPVSFPWNTGKNVSRDPLPKSTEFNMDDYAVLVEHPTPFQNFPKPFLCLVKMSRYYTLNEDTYPRFLHDNDEGRCLSLYIVHLVVCDLVFDYLFVYAEMDLFACIHVVDPTKVKIVERERAEGETKLLDSTIGHVVPLLPVALTRSKDDLEASVDKLFDEGGSTDQGDSAAESSVSETEIGKSICHILRIDIVIGKKQYKCANLLDLR
ncbi:hypothetical protein Tco_0516831 [Tanacetum coccineum]